MHRALEAILLFVPFPRARIKNHSVIHFMRFQAYFSFFCPSCQERSQKNGDIGCFGFLFDFASRSEVSSFLRLLASGRVCAILTGESGRG